MPTELTPLGEIAARYGVQTPPKFWQDLFKQIEEITEVDGDWEQMVNERIEGMTKLRDNYYRIAAGVSAFGDPS